MRPLRDLSYLRRVGGRLWRELSDVLLQAGKVNAGNRGVIRLIDVGAAGDLPEPWHRNARYVRTLLRFEPRESARTDPDVITLGFALGSANEVRTFYVSGGNDSHGSSLFEPNVEYVNANFERLRHLGRPEQALTWHERARVLTTIQVECKTLDTVLDTLRLEFSFDFLKIDAQGAEYEILCGAERFLQRHCLGMQVELFRVPLYSGIRLKDEVVDLLGQRGFELVKELPPHGTFHAASDCVFFRKSCPAGSEHKMQLLRRVYGV